MIKKMAKITPYVCKSEREFLELKGDGTESVKMDFYAQDFSDLNGWYVFLKLEGKNTFVRQSSHLPSIDRIVCETKYLQFDRGILPNSFNCSCLPVGIDNPYYGFLKSKLENVGEWKPIREVRKWEFVQ